LDSLLKRDGSDPGTAGQGTYDRNDEDSAEQSDYQGPEIETGYRIRYSKQGTGKEAAYEGSDNTKDDVSDNTITSPFHYDTSQPTGYQADDYPG